MTHDKPSDFCAQQDAAAVSMPSGLHMLGSQAQQTRQCGLACQKWEHGYAATNSCNHKRISQPDGNEFLSMALSSRVNHT